MVDIVGGAAKALQTINSVGSGLAQVVSNAELSERLDRIPTHLGPYGVDAFGFDPNYVKRFVGVAAWIYRGYFRAECFGIENLPKGRCFVVANHSGQLPYDAAMISMAAFLEHEPPRFLRSMVERFVPQVPFISTFLARTGQILGTPENCRRILGAGEAILVFPEGVRGLNKPWRKRYKVQRFGQGFMRLAIETETPIVPCAVIGAEEQAPSLLNLAPLGRLVGLPALPVSLAPLNGLLPLPTKYRIHFGAPMHFEGNANDEDRVINRKVEQVRNRVQNMVDDGLKARRAVFW